MTRHVHRCAKVISAVKREKGIKRMAGCFTSGVCGNELSITLWENSFISHASKPRYTTQNKVQREGRVREEGRAGERVDMAQRRGEVRDCRPQILMTPHAEL